MGTLRDEAEALNIEVDGRWSNQTLQRKIRDIAAIKEADELRATVPEKAVKVELIKNYKPVGWYNRLGYLNKSREFIAGEDIPAPQPGVSQEHKCWAGSVIELPADEAKRIVGNKIVSVERIRDEHTNQFIGSKEVVKPDPLAQVFHDWNEENAA